MSLKKHKEDGGYYLPGEKLVISEAFAVHNVKAPDTCLVTN